MGAQFVGRFFFDARTCKRYKQKLITSQNQSRDRDEDVSKLVIAARLWVVDERCRRRKWEAVFDGGGDWFSDVVKKKTRRRLSARWGWVWMVWRCREVEGGFLGGLFDWPSFYRVAFEMVATVSVKSRRCSGRTVKPRFLFLSSLCFCLWDFQWIVGFSVEKTRLLLRFRRRDWVV